MKKKSVIATIILLIIGILVAVALFFLLGRIERYYQLEAGETLQVTELLKIKQTEGVCFEDGTTEFCTNVPGVYDLKVNIPPFVHTVTVTVVDTTSPQAVLYDRVVVPYGKECEATAFVESVADATDVTISYVKEPDFQQFGIQKVQIALQDACGNTTHIQAECLVPKVDVEQPYVMEAGEELPEAVTLLLAEGKAQYMDGIGELDTAVPGVYPLKVLVDDYSCDVMMEVKDTVAPELEVEPKEWFLDTPMEASMFVKEINDETEVTFSFEKEADLTKEGEQIVVITAIDAGGNSVSKETFVTLAADTEGPIIMGAGDLSAEVGGVISYRTGISAKDNCDGTVTVVIDNSAVDLNTIGTYPVTYSAKDRAGNETFVEIKVTVMPERMRDCSMESMYALADEVLSKIIEEDMSLYDQAHAIYIWTKGNISFIDDSEKEDWVESAYNGFTYHKGDCYTYACVAKALLTRAGIPNVDVKRKSTLSKHYWNLVDVGDGWYHFDATPRVDKTTIFMWSENQLIADPAVNRSHVYDRSLYPTVNAD